MIIIPLELAWVLVAAFFLLAVIIFVLLGRLRAYAASRNELMDELRDLVANIRQKVPFDTEISNTSR